MEYDDTYEGKRFTYGLNFRPLSSGNVPDGWIIWSDKEDPEFTHGTVDYPFELSGEQIRSFQLTPLDRP